MKHQAYRLLSRAWKLAGKGAAGPGLRVLMYHSVGGALPEDPYGTSIPPKLFKEHMRRLAERGGWEPSPFTSPSEARRQLAVTFDDGYRDTLTTAAPVLQQLDIPLTVFVSAEHVRNPGRLYLSPEELKTLAALPGVLVGAHGSRHVPLDELPDDRLAAELRDSRAFLEDLIGRPVRTMSYPHGRVDRRVRDAAAAAGFTLAGCSRYGLNAPDRDPLLLCRTEITAWDSVDDLLLKVDGHWDWFARRHPDPAAK